MDKTEEGRRLARTEQSGAEKTEEGRRLARTEHEGGRAEKSVSAGKETSASDVERKSEIRKKIEWPIHGPSLYGAKNLSVER